MNALASLVALCLTPGIGGVTLRALLARFGDVETILSASVEELQETPGVGPRIAAAIQMISVPQIAEALQRWQQDGIQLLTWSHLDYPDRLHLLHDAPPVLFYRGMLLPDDDRAVGIVGTRSPTPQARRLAEHMGFELAKRGWTVVSGLAWGVDFAAHSGAVRGGRTIAITGSGVHAPLPGSKQTLAAQITGSGAILAEVHPDAAPTRTALVARNRLISGMSRAVIVIEAGENSGSMYTARFAYKQGRPIFSVDNGSAGNKKLLENGAFPLTADFSDWDGLHEHLNAL